MRIRAKLAAAAVLAVAVLTLMPGVASAHEEKHVGPYLLAVGFGTEPDAYAGYPNSVQLLLSKNDKPVVDLGDTLKVVVEFGDQSSDPMPLAPFFEIGEIGIPGDYRAFFVPSQPGDYTFHITGTIHGTKVDESFTLGPEDVRVGARRLECDVPAGPGADERGPRDAHPDRVRSDVDGAHRRDGRGDERAGGRQQREGRRR